MTDLLQPAAGEAGSGEGRGTGRLAAAPAARGGAVETR
jgi:hypothetical protein